MGMRLMEALKGRELPPVVSLICQALNIITETTPRAQVIRVVGYRVAKRPMVADQSTVIVTPESPDPHCRGLATKISKLTPVGRPAGEET